MTFLSDVVEPRNERTRRQLRSWLPRPKAIYYRMKNGHMVKSIWSVEQ